MIAVGRWLAAQAAVRGRHVAIRFGDEAISYDELAGLTARLSGLLTARLALPRGSRIAYLGHNTPEQLALVIACARAGMALVPLNWRLASRELEAVMADAEVAMLVVDEACGPLLTAGILERCSQRCYALRAPALPFPELRDVAATAPASAGCEDNAAAPLLLVYTSGTTGKPKGSILTQGAIAANAVNSQEMHALCADDIVLTTLPMFHVGGLNIQTLPALALGATVVLQSRFDPAHTLAAVARERPTLTVQVPATMQALLAHPAWASTDLGCLRAIATGSTDVPVELIDAIHARGVPVIQVYGATETAPIAICQQTHEAFAAVGSIGRPAGQTEIRLLKSDGSEAAVGEPGEILVRGAQVASGYWRDAARSAAAFRDGWFHSGDLALCDETGRYWFRDRLKNVIISGGENIYPAEIERVARRAPGVAECAVVGRPDAHWGQVPVLFAVPASGTLDRERLRLVFAASLARYKHPKAIIEVATLPRTALGKIDLGALREAASLEAG